MGEVNARRTLNRVQVIREFFEQPVADYPVRKLDIKEFQALNPADRDELGKACAAALGVDLTG